MGYYYTLGLPQQIVLRVLVLIVCSWCWCLGIILSPEQLPANFVIFIKLGMNNLNERPLLNENPGILTSPANSIQSIVF